MATKILHGLILTSLLCAAASAQDWSRYVPKKQRSVIIKRSVKGTGMGLAMTGQGAIAYWVTDQLARAMVSEAIDRERLSNEEAEAKYKQLRPEGRYSFGIDVRRIGGSRLGGHQ